MVRKRLRVHWRLITISLAALFAVWLAALIVIPPTLFSRDRVAQALAGSISGQAQFRSFRNVYFPHPGCVAEGVVIRREPDSPPLISTAKLIVVGSYASVLSKHVSLIKAEGLEVTPNGGGWPESRSNSTIVVDRFVTDNAVLAVRSDAGGQPLKFVVHHFVLENLGSNHSMSFKVDLTNPVPRGEISASGKLGPWQRQHSDTPVQGSYSFRDADLGVIGGIAGILSSDGTFQGTIRHLQVEGSTDTPQFEVTSTRHRFPLSTRFRAEVNAGNGNVILENINAKLGSTLLHIQGEVTTNSQQHNRTATLDITTRNGNIQDILYPFIRDSRSPLRGVTSWRAHIVLPSGKEPFRRKVKLEGEFGVADARFTNPRTQAKVDKASEQARGNPNDNDPEDVLSDLRGHVTLNNGTALFSPLSFSVPGAWAEMNGTYNLVNGKVNLHGTVRLQAKMSDATVGFKSFLLKAMRPFLRKDKPQEPLPVSITGTYHHPHYSVSVTKKQEHHKS